MKKIFTLLTIGVLGACASSNEQVEDSTLAKAPAETPYYIENSVVIENYTAANGRVCSKRKLKEGNAITACKREDGAWHILDLFEEAE